MIMYGRGEKMSKQKCEHRWVVLSKDILPSAYEQMVPGGGGSFQAESLPGNFFQKKIVIIMACEKCGMLDETVESNPGDQWGRR